MMLVVDDLMVESEPGPRVVWGGRDAAATPGALDGWSTGRTELLRGLDRAGELLLLDPMSFPWESLRPSDRDLPLVVVLPHDLDPSTISQVFGTPLLSRLTSVDRLVEPRADVRRALADEWLLDDAVWLDAVPEGDGHDRTVKGVWQAVRSAASETVEQFVSRDSIDLHHISVMATDPQLARAVSVDLGRDVRPVDPDDQAPADPRDHAVVVALPPGRRAEDRVRLFEVAHRRLRSGGLFALVATVVATTTDARDRVPSMDDLVEELDLATGMGLHVHEIRSLRWAAEPLQRGVLLAATSLSVPVSG